MSLLKYSIDIGINWQIPIQMLPSTHNFSKLSGIYCLGIPKLSVWLTVHTFFDNQFILVLMIIWILLGKKKTHHGYNSTGQISHHKSNSLETHFQITLHVEMGAPLQYQLPRWPIRDQSRVYAASHPKTHEIESRLIVTQIVQGAVKKTDWWMTLPLIH